MPKTHWLKNPSSLIVVILKSLRHGGCVNCGKVCNGLEGYEKHWSEMLKKEGVVMVKQGKKKVEKSKVVKPRAAKKSKTFICTGCQNEFSVKAFTPELVTMKKCPQCYTKEQMSKLPDNDKPKEKVCTICGNIATKESEYCDHQKEIKKPEATKVTVSVGGIELPALSKALSDPELPGMPPKGEETLIAEDILDMRDHLKGERENLKALVTKFANQMHLIQKSHLLVKGWEFDVQLQDKVTITKKK